MSEKTVYNVWTDASFHPRFPNIGCGALIEDNKGTLPCAWAQTHNREYIADSTIAEIVAIAELLLHLNTQDTIKLCTDSHGAAQEIEKIRHGETIPARILHGCSDTQLEIIERHPDLNIIRGNRGLIKIKIADDLAWFVRRGEFKNLANSAKKQGLELAF